MFLQYIELSIIKRPEEKRGDKEAEENSGTWVKIATFSQQSSNNTCILIKITAKCA